jgi:hypothetical protein
MPPTPHWSISTSNWASCARIHEVDRGNLAALDREHEGSAGDEPFEVAVARAAKKAQTSSRCSARSTAGAVAPRTRRLARLASCRAAAGVRSTMAAISRTQVEHVVQHERDRSAGASASSTMRRAGLIAPANPISVSAELPPGASGVGAGGSSHRDLRVRARRDTRARRRSSASRPGSHFARAGTADLQPGLLDGVIGAACPSQDSGTPPARR